MAAKDRPMSLQDRIRLPPSRYLLEGPTCRCAYGSASRESSILLTSDGLRLPQRGQYDPCPGIEAPQLEHVSSYRTCQVVSSGSEDTAVATCYSVYYDIANACDARPGMAATRRPQSPSSMVGRRPKRKRREPWIPQISTFRELLYRTRMIGRVSGRGPFDGR